MTAIPISVSSFSSDGRSCPTARSTYGPAWLLDDRRCLLRPRSHLVFSYKTTHCIGCSLIGLAISEMKERGCASVRWCEPPDVVCESSRVRSSLLPRVEIKFVTQRLVTCNSKWSCTNLRLVEFRERISKPPDGPPSPGLGKAYL